MDVVLQMDAPQPRLCRMIKRPDFQGYGFNLHAEKSKPGQFIGTVDEGSPAEICGLKEGDRIVEVNGVNISQENHKQVVQRIKAIANETKLLVVDPTTEEYYRKQSIVVKSTLPNVIYLSNDECETNNNQLIEDEDAIINYQLRQEAKEHQDLPPPLPTTPPPPLDEEEHDGNSFYASSVSKEEELPPPPSPNCEQNRIVVEATIESSEEETESIAASKIVAPPTPPEVAKDQSASSDDEITESQLGSSNASDNEDEPVKELKDEVAAKREEKIVQEEVNEIANCSEKKSDFSLEEQPKPLEEDDEDSNKTLPIHRAASSISSEKSSTVSDPSSSPRSFSPTQDEGSVSKMLAARMPSSASNWGGLNLNMTAREMREMIGNKKKRDPRRDDRLDFHKKYEIIQTL